MKVLKENKGCKDSNGENGSCTAPSSTSTRPNWNVMTVRGKVTDKCLWSACKAMTTGFLFIVVGAGMATLGFYSDHLSTVEETKGNTTVWVKNESKDTHLGSLTYLGPVVMGIGGFTIVAACVMTFEARDTAAKIVPIWFKRTRVHVVSGGSGSTPSERSSKTSWERFLSQQRPSEDVADARSAVTQALVNFSKYLQNSVDTNKMTSQNTIVTGHQGIGLRKCPSEPSLAKMQRDANGNNIPEAVALLEASTPQPSQRITYGGCMTHGLKTKTRTSKPQLLSVAPDAYRQVVSMDCPRSSNHQDNADDTHDFNATIATPVQMTNGYETRALPFQTSCTNSSSGSMSVDIYLPQGAITLKVHDDMKKMGKLPLKVENSDDSRCTKFSQQSDIQLFGDDDECYSKDIDDSVFINQDVPATTPQIILNTLELKIVNEAEICQRDNQARTKSVGDRSLTEYVIYSPKNSMDNKSKFLEPQSSEDSSRSLTFSAHFSLDRSDRSSPGIDRPSTVNLLSPRINTLSPTPQANNFMNMGSFGSQESSQEVESPLKIYDSPCFFNRSHQLASKNEEIDGQIVYSDTSSVTANEADKNLSISTLSKSLKYSPTFRSDLDPHDMDPKSIPTKCNSLDTAESGTSKSYLSSSTSTRLLSQGNATATSNQYLSSSTSSGLSSIPLPSQVVLPLSPRKSRSESLPERRPSIKRFPLLRQAALDTFAEEGGSMLRLERSQSQISTQDMHSPDA